MEKSIVLGNEYDQNLRQVLIDVLKELGGRSQSESWGVGGSQEIETLEVEVDGSQIVVEAETYVGLSIRGDADLVDRIASLVAARGARS